MVAPILKRATSEVILTREKINVHRAKIRHHLVLQAGTDSLKDFAFKISVDAALRERGNEARPVIFAELKQLMEKHVWHGAIISDLTRDERDKVIRCSMFLKISSLPPTSTTSSRRGSWLVKINKIKNYTKICVYLLRPRPPLKFWPWLTSPLAKADWSV